MNNKTEDEKRLDIESLENEVVLLFKRDSRRLLSFIRMRLRDQDEAEDVLQDVFANLLASAKCKPEQPPIENVASWVFTAVRNRIIDTYRKKRAKTFSGMKFPDDNSEDYENFIKDNSLSPEKFFLQNMIWEAIQKGLLELPEEQRLVFEKNEFDKMSFKEISSETGVNINTLLARKRYAVLHLRKHLKELYDSIK